RLPVGGTNDAIDELTSLFNAMLDKIEGLVDAMRGALDNVSHDLRTPLTRLRGTAEMALAAEPDIDRYREALADCLEESDRVLVMLNTLMDISEAESGTLQLTREPVSLHEVVDRAVDLYRDVAETKGVRLTVAPGDAIVVSGDRTRLEQVAANLIDNAVKYTAAGGRVDVEVARDGGRALLRVRDTGAGIPADELPRIWDRLFRGDTSRTERGGYIGLGVLVTSMLVTGAAWLGTAADPQASAVRNVSAVTTPITHAIAGGRDSYADVVKVVAPAVVTVRADGKAKVSPTDFQLPNDDFLRRFFGDQFEGRQPRQPRMPPQHAVGAGVIVSGDRY